MNDDSQHKGVLEPQVLVESGKVAPINVAYVLMRLISPVHGYSDELLTFPDQTMAEAHFTVDYFSLKGEQSAQAHYKFQFYVTDDYINTKRIQ